MGDANYNPIRVKISQFYRIEINDFAVSVAKTALWIAEKPNACHHGRDCENAVGFSKFVDRKSVV